MGNCENKFATLKEDQVETYSFMNSENTSQITSAKNRQSEIERANAEKEVKQQKEELTFGDTNYNINVAGNSGNGILGRRDLNPVNISRRGSDFKAPIRVQGRSSVRNSMRDSGANSGRNSARHSRRGSRDSLDGLDDLKINQKPSKTSKYKSERPRGSNFIKEFQDPSENPGAPSLLQQAKYQEILNRYPELDGIVDPLAITQKEENYVIYEGKLLKYKPGTAFNWVERWCVLTKSEFMYYKNQWNSYCYDMRPLVSIPINDVLAVFKVNLELPHNSNNKAKKNLALTSDQKTYKELFQFEIFNDMSDYPYYQEVFAKYEDEDYYETESSKEAEKTKQEFDVENLEGFKLWNRYEQDRRNRQSPSRVRDGHLMRLPQKVNKHYRNREGSHMKSIDFNSSNYTHHTSHHHLERSSKNATQSIDGFQGSGMKKAPYKKRNSPLKGAVYKWVKNNSDLTSWTNREKEWYFSEKRLLFAAPNIEERDRWVKLLQFVNNEIHDNNNPQQYTQ